MEATGGAVDPPPGAAADNMTARPGGALAPLGRPLFAGVWVANTVSNFGGQVQAVGAAWLMTSLTREPDTVALVTAAALLPIPCFSLLAGAVADAFDRRRVLLAAQSVMLSASVLLAWLSATGSMSPQVLIALTFMIGSGFAFNAPAWQAAVRDLVPVRDLPAAISLNIVGFNLSRTAGPALGGVIVAWGGVDASFVFNGLSYLGLMAVLAVWLRREGPARQARRRMSMIGAIRGGIRYAVRTIALRRMLLRVLAFGVALGALLALVPLVIRSLNAGPAGMGLVFAASGGGAVVGALLTNFLRARVKVEALLCAGIAATAIAMAAVAIARSLIVIAAAEIVTGFATTLVYSTLNILVQTTAPRRLLGRLLSIHQMAAFGGLAAGAWLWGEVADHVGSSVAILGAAVAMGAVMALSIVAPIGGAERRGIGGVQQT